MDTVSGGSVADTVEQWVSGWHSGVVGHTVELTQWSGGSVAGTVERWVSG